MEADLERVRRFQLILIVFGPSHEETLTNPLDIPCIPFHIVKPHPASDLILGFLNITKLPKFGQSDLEPFHLVYLTGIARMHKGQTIDLTKYDIFSFEGVLDVGGAIELDRQDGFFEGQSADIPIYCGYFQHETLISVVDVGLEVEIFTQYVLTLFLRRRTRGDYFFQLRYLKLETQFLGLQRLYVLIFLIHLSRYLLLLYFLLILVNVNASNVARLQHANYLLVIVLTEIVDEDCYYFLLQFDLGYCLTCAFPVF